MNSRTEEYVFEYLKTYEDLLDWTEKVNLLPIERIRKLREYSKKNEKESQQKLIEIIKQRELLYKIFSSIINQKTLDEVLVKEFNNSVSGSLSNLAFKFETGKINLVWKAENVDLMEPVWVIFKDAFDILTSISQNRIKACRACGWLFLDGSKNNSRTWCNMRTCGSSNKSRRYYHRKKEKQ